jgi:hypothetical protein
VLRVTRTAVPPAGPDRRSWIRFELGKIDNPETGRRWLQADIAREAETQDSHVSLIFTGERDTGPKADRVRRITARVLGMTTDALFGVALPSGQGYPGSPGAEEALESDPETEPQAAAAGQLPEGR